MKKTTPKKQKTLAYEPDKVLFMSVVVAVLTMVLIGSIGMLASA